MTTKHKRSFTLWVFTASVLGFFLGGCEQPNLSPLEKALWSAHPAMLKVLHDPKFYEIQIIYSQIDRDERGGVSFTDYTFRSDSASYFYPASTVKLPMAVLAMEWADSHQKITAHTPYWLANDSLTHTIIDDIRQIFAVSDNDAYNRLYELLGRDYVNSRMKELGIPAFRLAHRLATENSADSIRKPIYFIIEQDTLSMGGGIDQKVELLHLKGIAKGKGFVHEDEIIHEPMDFSEKNYFPLWAQQEFMKRIFFPESYPMEQQLRLTEASRSLIQQQMSTLPRENGYTEEAYYDSYGKLFLYGDSKDPIPPEVKIYNKVGYAFGTLTDTAYIVDETNEVEFLLTATILVNANGIFNDDNYEYDTLGIPFLAQLGREMYLQERSRN